MTDPVPADLLAVPISEATPPPGTATDNAIRTGTVQSLSPLTVALQGGTVVRPGRIFGLQLAVGTNVAMIRQDNTWLVLGRVVDETVTSPGPLVTGDSGWIIPTLVNGWSDFAFDWQGARYRKLATGVVEVQGLVKGGAAGTTIFTLPVGYRPGNSLIFATLANATSARLDVYPDGRIQWISGGTNAWVSLSPAILYGDI